MALIPEAQIVRLLGGEASIDSLKWAGVSGLSEATLGLLRQDLPRMTFAQRDYGNHVAILAREECPLSDNLPTVPQHPEAYALEIGEERVTLAARDAAGLWYGFQTLLELTALHGGRVPRQIIQDWPIMAMRGIHVDLKGCQPRPARLLELCRLLARYKVNHLLLEVEDKFAFGSAPGMAVPEAYDRQTLTALAEQCQAMHIELIPKLQSLGHVDYLLRHERYRHLAENGHPYQYCPRNEEGQALWNAMCVELHEALPGGRYFHIGADETSHLGECETCRTHSKGASYIHRVNNCLEQVEALGRTPIMWDDILRNLHGHLSEEEARSTWHLGQRAILMYWVYGYGGRNNRFPLLADYLGADCKIWGASGYSGCGPSWIQDIAPYRERVLNIDAWTQAAVSAGLPGVMATGWGKIASADPPAEPMEACWLPMLYSAASTWNGRACSPETFAGAVARSFFGSDDPALAAWLADADRSGPPATPLRVRRHRQRFRLLVALAAMRDHQARRARLIEHQQMYRKSCRDGSLVDYRRTMLGNVIADFGQKREAAIKQFRQALRPFYVNSTVESLCESRFGIDEELMQLLEGAGK